MLFLLSKNIGARRKVIYYGLMFLTMGIVFSSMIDFDPIMQEKIYSWAAAISVAGISLIITSTALYPPIRSSKERWGFASFLVYAFLIPVFICVMTYVILILSSHEFMGEKYFLHNLVRIMPLTAPCILLAEVFLFRNTAGK